MVRAQDAQRIGILVHRLDEALRECANRLAISDRTGDNFVVDIGDVAHMRYREIGRFEPAPHDIKRNQRAGVPHMAKIVHCHAANIHPYFAGR